LGYLSLAVSQFSRLTCLQLYGWLIIKSHYPLFSLAIGQRGIVKHDIFNLPLFDNVGQQAILPLHAIAATGDTRIVEPLLKIISNANERYSYALHAASSKGHLEVIQLLLKAGTDVNAATSIRNDWLGSNAELLKDLV
jgi:hypothetical protein